MSKKLFILQSVCQQRVMCKQCRDPNNATYRNGWAERYEMPRGWPNCPLGYPWGFAGFPEPVAWSRIQTMIEKPGTEDAEATRKQIEQRAQMVRDKCLRCPGKYFKGISEDGLTVDCQVGYACCGGGLSRGNVYLGSGLCQKGYWTAAQPEK